MATATMATPSRYLQPGQVEFFQHNGCLLVKSGVPMEMVHTLRTVTQQQIEGEVGTIIWQDRDKKLPGDAALRADLIRRGMARAVQFPWSRTAAETVRVYTRVLHDRV